MTYMDSEAKGKALLSQLIKIYFTISGIMGFTWSIYAPFLNQQGFTGLEYGLAASASVASSLIGTILIGFLVDKYGSRKIISLNLLLYSASIYILSLGGFINTVFASTIWGFASSYWIALTTLTSKSLSDEELDRAFTYTRSASLLGTSIGSFMGWVPIIVMDLTGKPIIAIYRASILLSGLIIIPISIQALFLKEEYARAEEKLKEGGVDREVMKTFLKLSIVQIVIGFGAALSIHNIDYYFVWKYRVSSGELGSAFGLENLLLALLMLYMPKFSRRVGGPLKAYLIATSPSIPLIIAITLTNHYGYAVAFFIARTVLMNVSSPLYEAFQMGLLPISYRGRGSAVLSIAWAVPTSIARGLGGYLLDINLELPLRLTSVLYTSALIMLTILFPQHIRARRSVGTGE
jgi:MFS family permease